MRFAVPLRIISSVERGWLSLVAAQVTCRRRSLLADTAVSSGTDYDVAEFAYGADQSRPRTT